MNTDRPLSQPQSLNINDSSLLNTSNQIFMIGLDLYSNTVWLLKATRYIMHVQQYYMSVTKVTLK